MNNLRDDYMIRHPSYKPTTKSTTGQNINMNKMLSLKNLKEVGSVVGKDVVENAKKSVSAVAGTVNNVGEKVSGFLKNKVKPSNIIEGAITGSAVGGIGRVMRNRLDPESISSKQRTSDGYMVKRVPPTIMNNIELPPEFKKKQKQFHPIPLKK